MGQILPLFTVPYFKGRIDPSRYDKNTIVNDIKNNYLIDPNRNEWDNNKGSTRMHHSYGDDNNGKFKKINFESVSLLYKEQIQEFLDKYFTNTVVGYKWYIVNYTCVSGGQFMREHNHPFSDWSAIHYLKFNPNKDKATAYTNPCDWAYYTQAFFSDEMRKAHSQTFRHSWMQSIFSPSVEEDDFAIMPSSLRHHIPYNDTDELRMTIVMHIDIIPK